MTAPQPQFTIHHSLFTISREAALWLALAAIPIGSTIIHPLLGLACTLATLRTVYRLGNRAPFTIHNSQFITPPRF